MVSLACHDGLGDVELIHELINLLFCVLRGLSVTSSGIFCLCKSQLLPGTLFLLVELRNDVYMSIVIFTFALKNNFLRHSYKQVVNYIACFCHSHNVFAIPEII